jgi:multidrug resistance protein
VALITAAAFTDILAYSIAVPVLPDIGRRFGAGPSLIGILFASFGLTVLTTSVPMGALSDRTGRKLPLVAGLVALAVSSVLFAFAPSLSWLFAARLVQGAADAVTWVVGFAVIADLYTVDERGKVMGLVMSGTTFGFMIGPTAGGWLYEQGGAATPYLVVAGLSILCAIGLMLLPLPKAPADHQPIPIATIGRVPAVAVCAIAVIVGGGTIAMLEPILSLYLSGAIGLGPARIGLVFGAGAIVAAFLHPVSGRIADRVGGRRLTLAGLAAVGATLPLLALTGSFRAALIAYPIVAIAIAMLVTPSLTYMADAVSTTGERSFGVAYGIYNFAWAVGLLIGPALGGFLFERMGFLSLSVVWGAVVIAVTLLLSRAGRLEAPPGAV